MKHSIVLTLSWDRRLRERQINYARERGYGLEIVGFTLPDLYNDEELYVRSIDEYRRDLDGFTHPLSFHGAFIDVVPHSEDRAIKEIGVNRIKRSIETALLFGIKRIVFHPNLNSANKDPRYIDRVIREQGAFWGRILDEYPDMTICIENIFDSEPVSLKSLRDECGSDRLRFCFDAGHFNVFSKWSMAEWFWLLGESVDHFHLHDNPGDWDRHLPVGEGTFDWKILSGIIKQMERDLWLVVEVMTFEGQKTSLMKLSEVLQNI